MKIPPGHTEESVLEAIEKAVAILSPVFVFGYFDLDDAKQQARLKALELLESERYDPSRPLANFIYTHIRNRLCNWKRDRFRRNDPPCKHCHETGRCAGDKPMCQRYCEWLLRNDAKTNLMRPLGLDSVGPDRQSRPTPSVEQNAEYDEMLEKIDLNLPVDLRADYLRMRDGVKIPRARRMVVMAAIREILA